LAGSPAAQHKYKHHAQVLAMILGDSTGSKTYWQLVDTGLADGANIDTSDMDGTGFVMAYASTEPKNLDKVTEILRNIMLSARDFSELDLERVKTKLKTRIVLSGENSTRRLMAIGTEWVYNKQYQTLDDELATISKITKSDILDMLSEFDFSPVTEMRLIGE
jgi:predicted Zn-dependent peptidase